MTTITRQLKINDVVVAQSLALVLRSKLEQAVGEHRPRRQRLALVSSSAVGRTAAVARVAALPRLDLLYFWFMDFDCAHQEPPCLTLPRLLQAGRAEGMWPQRSHLRFLQGHLLRSHPPGKWPTSRFFVIEITVLAFWAKPK